MEAILTIGGVSAPVKVYERTSKAGKKGFGLLGRIPVNGAEHMVNGFISPVTPMAAEEKAAKKAARKAFEAEWAKRNRVKL
jgi:hypothetical protein